MDYNKLTMKKKLINLKRKVGLCFIKNNILILLFLIKTTILILLNIITFKTIFIIISIFIIINILIISYKDLIRKRKIDCEKNWEINSNLYSDMILNAILKISEENEKWLNDMEAFINRMEDPLNKRMRETPENSYEIFKVYALNITHYYKELAKYSKNSTKVNKDYLIALGILLKWLDKYTWLENNHKQIRIEINTLWEDLKAVSFNSKELAEKYFSNVRIEKELNFYLRNFENRIYQKNIIEKKIMNNILELLESNYKNAINKELLISKIICSEYVEEITKQLCSCQYMLFFQGIDWLYIYVEFANNWTKSRDDIFNNLMKEGLISFEETEDLIRYNRGIKKIRIIKFKQLKEEIYIDPNLIDYLKEALESEEVGFITWRGSKLYPPRRLEDDPFLDDKMVMLWDGCVHFREATRGEPNDLIDYTLYFIENVVIIGFSFEKDV